MNATSILISIAAILVIINQLKAFIQSMNVSDESITDSESVDEEIDESEISTPISEDDSDNEVDESKISTPIADEEIDESKISTPITEDESDNEVEEAEEERFDERTVSIPAKTSTKSNEPDSKREPKNDSVIHLADGYEIIYDKATPRTVELKKEGFDTFIISDDVPSIMKIDDEHERLESLFKLREEILDGKKGLAISRKSISENDYEIDYDESIPRVVNFSKKGSFNVVMVHSDIPEIMKLKTKKERVEALLKLREQMQNEESEDQFADLLARSMLYKILSDI